MNTLRNRNRIYTVTAISVCTASIIISAWLTIPFFIGITLQTLAIFLICLLFDFKIAFFSVVSYIFIGAIGLPVFSGFGSGIVALLGPTGGFVLSFMLFPVIFKLLGARFRRSHLLRIFSMLLCLVICYICGTLWYCCVFASGEISSIWSVLAICVFPFIVPDLIKILLADIIYYRLSKIDLNR